MFKITTHLPYQILKAELWETAEVIPVLHFANLAKTENCRKEIVVFNSFFENRHHSFEEVVVGLVTLNLAVFLNSADGEQHLPNVGLVEILQVAHN